MSTVVKKGKLIPVPYSGDETPNDVAKRLLQLAHGKRAVIKLPSWAEDFVEYLEEDMFEQYVAFNGIIYGIEEESISELYQMKENGNGELEYTVKYNDTAISHPEVLRELIEETI